MRKITYFIGMFLLALVMLAIALNIHELGHTIVAQLAGDQGAKYFLYRHDPNHGTCIGCNIYDETRLSYLGNVAVTLGGVAITQLVSLGLLVFGSRQKLRSLKRRASLLAAAVFAIDAPLQVFQALYANVAAQQTLTRVDLADTLYLLTQQRFASATALKIMLVCALCVYAALLAYLYVKNSRVRSS